MTPRSLSRRDLLRGSVALAAYGLASRPLTAFGLAPAPAETVIPWLDVQPKGRAMLNWQELTGWVTPNESLYEVSHYGKPKVDLANWRLQSIAARAVRRPDGSVRFTGAAWSDGTPLRSVEIRIPE